MGGMRLSAPRSILLVCVRYIGDSLLMRAPLRAVRRAHPAARIDLLVAEGTACALEGCTDVDRVLEWPRRGGLRMLGELFRTGYDWAVDFTGNDRTALAVLASRAGVRVAYDRPKLPCWSLRRAAYTLRVPPKVRKPHIVHQRLELLEALGVPPDGSETGLVATETAWAETALAGLPRPILHAHVTSRDMQKALPVEAAIRMAEAQIAAGGSLVFTAGRAAAERGHASAIAAKLPCDRVRVFDDLSWARLVSLIGAADAFWGADTAPSHIASALQKPMLVEFGPSKSDHWHPLHSAGHFLVHPCECLKKNVCPAGTSGRCLSAAGGPAAVEWLERLQA